ncbi:DMT family transporter [Halobacillus yeomjeoni]|uniref:DMT family transporter n=1 Tax=Halobacillus yeomjeoni TaxID=311194 RepID=A0A931HXK3_9BACI|nr:DMT family transporter [Halobacillus yeomjeoni]MBH0231323.1 DMT family transporter [Halobacillus yeomjeoni]
MKGVFFSILAGLCITLQGIFNSKMGTELSGWHTTVVVHFVAFSLSLLVYMRVKDGNKAGMKRVSPIYFIGGAFGVPVVFSELTAIQLLGPAAAISILLVAQLGAAFFVELLGWFGEKKQLIKRHQVIGLTMIVVGVLIFKI